MQVHKALVLLGLGALLVWGTAADKGALKIGVVDIDQAFNSTDEGKAAREELARKKREAEAQVQPMIERYKGLEEDLQAKRFVLSDEALDRQTLDVVVVPSPETLSKDTRDALRQFTNDGGDVVELPAEHVGPLAPDPSVAISDDVVAWVRANVTPRSQ